MQLALVCVSERGDEKWIEIILASHGKFASGILDSLELIYGKNHSITVFDCYTDENFDLAETVRQLL